MRENAALRWTLMTGPANHGPFVTHPQRLFGGIVSPIRSLGWGVHSGGRPDTSQTVNVWCRGLQCRNMHDSERQSELQHFSRTGRRSVGDHSHGSPIPEFVGRAACRNVPRGDDVPIVRFTRPGQRCLWARQSRSIGRQTELWQEHKGKGPRTPSRTRLTVEQTLLHAASRSNALLSVRPATQKGLWPITRPRTTTTC